MFKMVFKTGLAFSISSLLTRGYCFSLRDPTSFGDFFNYIKNYNVKKINKDNLVRSISHIYSGKLWLTVKQMIDL